MVSPAQPVATFGGVDLYPGLQEKAAALCFSLVSNHPFIDGNKRVGHAALQIFLRLKGKTIEASVDENEAMCFAACRRGSRARRIADLDRITNY